jgi:ankyrin repeat protein
MIQAMRYALLFTFGAWALAAQIRGESESFYTAIRANDLARLEALLKRGANVNAKDSRGLTPLMYCAVAGSAQSMKLLIDKGADVNARNAFGSTALMWSVTDREKVRLLVEHGADVNAASNKKHTALLLAVMSDQSAEIARFLIAKGANINAVDDGKITALNAATYGNDTETIKILIEAGQDVNAADIVGLTPLMNAAVYGNTPVVRLLLAKGAKINAVSARYLGENVKNGAIQTGLLTPLLSALMAPVAPAPEFVKTLLDAGARVNAQDVRGMTPLMAAVETDRQNHETVRLLLSRQASVSQKSATGETALDWARKFGSEPILGLLKQAPAPGTPDRPTKVTPAAPPDVNIAVQRGVALMEKTSHVFFVNGACVSCHHQIVTDIAANVARSRGIRVDEAAQAERRKMITSFYGSAGPMLLERVDGGGSPLVQLYTLAALAAGGYQPDRMTDAMTANLIAQQLRDGRWQYVQMGARPPLEDGDFACAALGIRALSVYGPPGRIEIAERIQRARNWLLEASPLTTDDRNMQLLGLHWAGTDVQVVQKLARGILDRQRANGGWAQRTELESDAYATGQTLFALAEAEAVSPKDAAYQRAVKYLLANQRADGSWFVRSRAAKIQPYFESGFPYGPDQWISAMATGWATAALAMSF